MIAPGPSPPEHTTAGVGLAYGIAIAMTTLVLISAIILASYACLRRRFRARTNPPQLASPSTAASRNPTPSGRAVLPGPVLAKVCWPDMRGARYPKLVLGESKRLPGPNSGPCSICLAEYKAKETIRCMPDCNHCFHVTCIDQWLQMSPTCPICRSSPAPSAAGTPLSDLVPLAFHPR